MTKNRSLIIPAVILGIVLLVVAVVYFADTASALPSFFPGHQAGSSHHHTKHGIAALVVALGCFVFAWFQSGPKSSRSAAT
jgi:flagellar basal body-associated protein FliL